jgi:hypothetical protein
MSWFLITLAALVLLGLTWFYKNQRQSHQLEYIKRYHFHNSIKNKLLKKHPQLTDEQIHLVFRGLRDYFYICNRAKKKMIAMPSQVVDDAWHEYILFTRACDKFSKKALGYFLHHTPSEAMASATWAQDGIKRAWRLACAEENIDPSSPDKLPLLFRIDEMLNITNGFTHALNSGIRIHPVMVRVIVPVTLPVPLAVPVSRDLAINQEASLMGCLILWEDLTAAEDAGEIDTSHKTSR